MTKSIARERVKTANESVEPVHGKPFSHHFLNKLTNNKIVPKKVEKQQNIHTETEAKIYKLEEVKPQLTSKSMRMLKNVGYYAKVAATLVLGAVAFDKIAGVAYPQEKTSIKTELVGQAPELSMADVKPSKKESSGKTNVVTYDHETKIITFEHWNEKQHLECPLKESKKWGYLAEYPMVKSIPVEQDGQRAVIMLFGLKEDPTTIFKEILVLPYKHEDGTIQVIILDSEDRRLSSKN